MQSLPRRLQRGGLMNSWFIDDLNNNTNKGRKNAESRTGKRS